MFLHHIWHEQSSLFSAYWLRFCLSLIEKWTKWTLELIQFDYLLFRFRPADILNHFVTVNISDYFLYWQAAVFPLFATTDGSPCWSQDRMQVLRNLVGLLLETRSPVHISMQSLVPPCNENLTYTHVPSQPIWCRCDLSFVGETACDALTGSWVGAFFFSVSGSGGF